MNAQRAPFVSGLSGNAKADAALRRAEDVANEAGLAILQHIRARALAVSKLLAPLAVPRFDGVERIVPDAQDIEAKAAADAAIALVDGILADSILLLRVTAMLARRKA